MLEIAISSLPDAVRRIAGKTPVASRLSSAEWADVPLALRERAQFSARVESVRLVSTIQEKLEKRIGMVPEQVAHGEAWVGRESFIADVRGIAVAEGVQTTGEAGAGGLQDIRSNRRLGLIYDFQTRQAAEFARWKVGEDPDVLDAYPAQELIREEDRNVPRDWRTRWAGKGGRFYEGRMIALKSDPVWTAISTFGTPFPPFDFGSGMGIEDISREEAEQLGVLPVGARVAPQGERDFNQGLESSAAGLSPEAVERLQMDFGDQVSVTRDSVRWQVQGDGYRTPVEMGLAPASSWPLPPAPPMMELAEAQQAFAAGRTVHSPEGRAVTFDQATYDHWDGYPDQDRRAAFLPWALDTVTQPHERWIQATQDVFLKAYTKPVAKLRGCMVTVAENGTVRTYFVRDLKEMDGVRKGLNVKVYERS